MGALQIWIHLIIFLNVISGVARLLGPRFKIQKEDLGCKVLVQKQPTNYVPANRCLLLVKMAMHVHIAYEIFNTRCKLLKDKFLNILQI